MSTIVLHDNALSSNAQKTRLMLDILGLDYELREVPFGAIRPEWHLAINPVGGIPALIDGDFQLAESNTILRYLADREGRNDLYPRDAKERATVDWVLDLWAIVIRPALFRFESLAYGIVPGDGLFAKPCAIADELAPVFDKVAPQIERAIMVLDPVGPWACLGRMTIADIAAAPALHRLLHAPVDFQRIPRLQAWAEACVGIPAWQPLAAISGVPNR